MRRCGLGSAQYSRVRRQEPEGLWVPRGELLAPCVFLVGVRKKKGMLVSVEAPLSLLDAVSFLGCGECVPHTILVGYMC